MTYDIIKDLTAKRGMQVFALLTEFNRNAGWAGYFYDGPEASVLREQAAYEKINKHGLHITIWHVNNKRLNPSDFIRLVMETRPYTANVLGYADDGKNQAIAVSRPVIYMQPTVPHITISTAPKCNPSAAGYMHFSNPVPVEIPKTMRDGDIKVIMQNNKEMDLTIFRTAIKALGKERMAELAEKLPPQVKEQIDRHFNMSWDALKNHLAACDLVFNENTAKLYAQYCTHMNNNKDDLELTNEVCSEPVLA
jgi:hypothetical protein